MAKKRDPDTTKTAKALAIYDDLLFTGRKASLSELAAKHKCSKPTILRIMEEIALRSHLESELDDHGHRWFRLARPSTRPWVSINPEAIKSLVSCRNIAASILPAGDLAQADDAIAKASLLVPSPTPRGELFGDFVRTQPLGSIDYTKSIEIIDELARAITSKYLCEVAYCSPWSAHARVHLLAPLRLIAHKDSLYLRCQITWPDGKAKPDYDPMLLAVQRIKAVTITDWKSRVEESNGPATFGLMKNDTPFEAKIKFTDWAAPYVRERIWSEDQQVAEVEGGVVLTLTSESEAELISWVLWFGADAELIGPAALRRTLLDITESLSSRYRSE